MNRPVQDAVDPAIPVAPVNSKVLLRLSISFHCCVATDTQIDVAGANVVLSSRREPAVSGVLDGSDLSQCHRFGGRSKPVMFPFSLRFLL